MKKSLKKVIILVMAIVTMVSSVCVTGININKPIKFTPRFSAPGLENPCYYSDNIFCKSGFGIPNCTAYAWGRVYELTGKIPKLSTSDAGNWFEYNKNNNIYPYGTAPRLGAIACFSNIYGGHVAVVEQIENNTITFSNSAYGGKEFYISTADVSDANPGQEGWTFQGYIYPDSFEKASLYVNGNYKVTANSLNLREYPTVQGRVLRTIPENSQIFISEVYESEGYLWGEAMFDGKLGYCALNFTVRM